jgi:signal peptide peptidase SppA
MYGLISQRMGLMSYMSGGTSIDEMRATLREALDDSDVRAIVFDIDSPGGSVDGITEFATELRAARAGDKPIIGQVNTLAASAAYWLATQMSEVVITPSGEVGSIGVFAVHEDYSKADEMMGVKTTLVSAGKFKVEGNEFEPLTDEARAAIQEQVDTFYQSFVADVAKGRGITTTVVADGYGEGRTMLAKKALAAGMVDRIDTIEATVRRFQPRGALSRAAATVIPLPVQSAAAAASVRRADPAWNAAHAAKPRRRRI